MGGAVAIRRRRADRARVSGRRLVGLGLIGVAGLFQGGCAGTPAGPGTGSSPQNTPPAQSALAPASPAPSSPPAFPVSPFVVVPSHRDAPRSNPTPPSSSARPQPPAAGVPPPIERAYGTPRGPLVYAPDPNARADDQVRRQGAALKLRLRQQRRVLRLKQSGDSARLNAVHGDDGLPGSHLQTPAQIQTEQQQQDLDEIQRHGRVY